MRILFVSPYVPSRIRVRPYYWVTGLAALGHEVCLYCLTHGSGDDSALAEMRRTCASVVAVKLPRWRPLINCARALPGSEPLQLVWSRLPRFSDALRDAVRRERFDAAHIEHLRAATFADALQPLPVIYDAVDSITLLFERARNAGPRARDRWMAALDARRTARFESGSLRRFDRVLVSSREDAERLQDLGRSENPSSRGRTAGDDRQAVILPNPVDLEFFRPGSQTRDPETVLFSGKMSYHANLAAALDLVNEIMPHVWKLRSTVRVVLAGQNPPRALRQLARDTRVSVTGFTPDLRPFLSRATLAVCPLRYGVGIQNKVLEAMAMGLPVIAKPAAVQALEVTSGDELAVADSATAFAGEILRLLGAPDIRARLAERARAYVERQHAPLTLARRLETVYREVQAHRHA